MNFRSLIITSLLIGLAVIALFTFSTNFTTDNNTNISLFSDTRINNSFSNLNSELSSVESTADSQREAFEKEGQNPIISALGFVFSSIVSAGTTFMNVGIGLFTSIFTLGSETVFGSTLVSGVLMAILIFTIVFAIWRVIRAGE